MDADDVLIRAYNNCPNLNLALQQWYLSPQFVLMSQATQTFRTYVGSLLALTSAAYLDLQYLDSNPFELQNWYNVWDEFNTWNSTNGYAGNPVPNVGNMTLFEDGTIIPETGGLANVPYVSSKGPNLFGQITWLAYWLETNKMNSGLVGSYAGGPLLGDLNNKIVAATAAYTGSSNVSTQAYSAYALTSTYPRLVVISAHYNVQLGILGALKVDNFLQSLGRAAALNAAWISVPALNVTGAIPSAAATLVFELHRGSTGSYAVRAVFQNGPGTVASPKKYVTMPLPCQSAAGAAIGGQGACTLADFNGIIAGPIASAGTAATWCALCAAKTPMPCLAARTTASAGSVTRSGLGLVASALLMTIIVHTEAAMSNLW